MSVRGAIWQVQSDSKNELIVPVDTGSTEAISIYDEGRNGHLCLPQNPADTFSDPYGQPNDATSFDGKTYYVANRGGGWGSANVAVCRKGRRPGCYRQLAAPSYYNQAETAGSVFAVTANASGVYAEVSYYQDGFDFPELVYWKDGTGTGTVLSGFDNQYFGSLQFDGLGDLLQTDGNVLDVYSGCPSACDDHQFGLNGYATYGSLGNGDSTFMTLDQATGKVDVYQYNGIYGITYRYSNGTGLYPSAGPVGIAQRLN